MVSDAFCPVLGTRAQLLDSDLREHQGLRMDGPTVATHPSPDRPASSIREGRNCHRQKSPQLGWCQRFSVCPGSSASDALPRRRWAVTFTRLKKLIGMLFAVLVLAAVAGAAWKFWPRSTGPQSVSGTIQVDETRVASRYGGRVVKINAAEGDALKAGQLLIELAAPELSARRQQLAAQLDEQVAGPRKEEIDAARHEVESLTADLNLARADVARSGDLFRDKVISPSERDRWVNRAQVLEKNTAAAKSKLDLLLAGTRPERIALTKAQLAELEAQEAELKISAPSDSVLEVLSVKVGDVLAPNREAATLLLTNQLWLRVFVPEPWLGHLQTGQSVTLKVDAAPDREFHGVIEQIQRSAEFTPRNVQTTEERIKQVFGVKIRLDPREGMLRAGMSADVFFQNMPPAPKQ